MTVVRMTDKNGQPWYWVHSSIVDAPITCAMTCAELLRWWETEHGRKGKEELIGALPRIERYGSSSFTTRDARSIIEICNRAGRGETWLSAAQELELVVRRRDEPSFEMDGTPQDMVCCMCTSPIASKADRVWRGDDPAHRRCSGG